MHDGNTTHLVQVDHIQLLSCDAMEQPSFFIQKHNLERLELLGEFPCRNVRIDVEDLAIRGLCEAGEYRECTRANGGLQRALVDTDDTPYEPVLVLVEVVCGEDAGSNRPCTGAEALKCPDELEVLLEEDASCDFEGPSVLWWDAQCQCCVGEGWGVEKDVKDAPVTRIPSM